MPNSQARTDLLRQQALDRLRNNQLPEAARLIEDYCRLDSNDAEAWETLGKIYTQLGATDKVVVPCEQLARLEPHSTLRHYNLAVALYQAGSLEDAITSYHKVLQLDPDNSNAHFGLGVALQEHDNTETAIGHYREALRIRPEWPEATYNLAITLTETGALQEASRILENSLETIGPQPKLYIALGSVYEEDCQVEKSIQAFQNALQLDPQNTDALARLGNTYLREGNTDDALMNYRKALDIDPHNIMALTGTIEYYDINGEYSKASRLLLPLLEKHPEHVVVALEFASLCKHLDRCSEAIGMLIGLLKRGGITRAFRKSLHFALGKLLDSAGEYDKAFLHYQEGNRLKKHSFDAQRCAAETEVLMSIFSRDLFARQAPHTSGANRKQMVFIVGMMRSGTSLVEQILACHSRVFGAGELDFLSGLAVNMATITENNLSYPFCIPHLTEADHEKLARLYTEQVEQLYNGTPSIITDKMPGNFLYLGLIQLLFPDARIIHCTRNPMDTCLSIYFQDFVGAHNHAYDLRAIGAFYHQYQKLMAHWHETLSLPILDVCYEEMVADTEGVSRTILEFLGLEWEAQCLDFHKSGRFVKTASKQQVNKPVYRSSIERWKNYRSHLDPLESALKHGL